MTRPITASALLLGIPLALPLFLLPDDWMGWMVLYITILVPIVYLPFRAERGLFLAGVSISLVAAALAIINSYFLTLPGGEADAARFLQQAAYFAEAGHLPEYNGGATVYVAALSLIFSVFGPSVLLAHSLSALATVLTLPLLDRLRTALMGSRQTSPGLLLVSALLPSCLLFKSAVLRESWQALFFTAFIYSLCILRMRVTLKRLLFFAASGGLAAALHTALALAFAGGGAALLWGLAQAPSRSSAAKAFLIMVALALCFPMARIGFSVASADRRVREISAEISPGSADNALAGLQREGRGGATYATAPGMTNLTLRIPVGIFYYWLAPFPWQIRNIVDFHAFFENIIRVLLALGFLTNFRRLAGSDRRGITVAFSMVLALEFFWSLGTTNWGTAIRHHIPSFAILCAVGFPARRLYALQPGHP